MTKKHSEGEAWADATKRPTVLVTGSHGLVGTALSRRLQRSGYQTRGFDLRGTGADRGDTRDLAQVRRALRGAAGVVHLAAVSRVVWAERDPERCWLTNVRATQDLLDACCDAAEPPWVLFASSREVYGQPDSLPATEDAPLRPVNTYGRSKVAGEELTVAARSRGLRTAIVRLANVYGSTDDHADRVTPAFARTAALGGELRVEGANHTFDFTHIDDVTEGLMRLVLRLERGETSFPPIHLLPGVRTTLGELARMAIDLSGTRATMRSAPPRSYDVSHFVGDPSRARELLDGWEATVPIRDGLARLIGAFQAMEVAS